MRKSSFARHINTWLLKDSFLLSWYKNVFESWKVTKHWNQINTGRFMSPVTSDIQIHILEPWYIFPKSLKSYVTGFLHLPLIKGTNYSKVAQIKFVVDSLYKILLGPLLNILSQKNQPIIWSFAEEQIPSIPF